MKKHIMVAAAAATIGIAGLGAGVAHAATTSTNSTTQTDPRSSLVDAIAAKFNLNKSDVQQVFDTQKTQMEANREAQVKADVAQLVKDGKITQAQADLINAKRAELQQQRETNKTTLKGMSQAERKATMEKQRTDLESWAKNNGIDTQYLRYVMGGGHGHGGPGGHHGDFDESRSTASGTTNQ